MEQEPRLELTQEDLNQLSVWFISTAGLPASPKIEFPEGEPVRRFSLLDNSFTPKDYKSDQADGFVQ